MNRKVFILASTVVITGISIPVIMQVKRNARLKKPLNHPVALMNYLDGKEISNLGFAYRSKARSEYDEKQLKILLLTDSNGKTLNEDDPAILLKMIEKESKTDFETGKTIVLDGWVLSVTEARQCALYSINPD